MSARFTKYGPPALSLPNGYGAKSGRYSHLNLHNLFMRFLPVILLFIIMTLFVDISNAHSPLPYPQAKDGWRISVENLKDTRYILKGRVIKKIIV